jgi:hypothetical protein
VIVDKLAATVFTAVALCPIVFFPVLDYALAMTLWALDGYGYPESVLKQSISEHFQCSKKTSIVIVSNR